MDEYVCQHCGNRIGVSEVEVPLQGRRQPEPGAKIGVALRTAMPICRHVDAPDYIMLREPPAVPVVGPPRDQR